MFGGYGCIPLHGCGIEPVLNFKHSGQCLLNQIIAITGASDLGANDSADKRFKSLYVYAAAPVHAHSYPAHFWLL